MNPHLKNLALWLVIGLIVVLVFNIFNQSQPMQRELSVFDGFHAAAGLPEKARKVTLFSTPRSRSRRAPSAR